MEATREIYWNIGNGVVLPMYLLFAATVAAFCWGFRKRIRVYRSGLPLDRTSHPLRRLVRAASLTLAQLRVMRKSSASFSVAGIFHAGFFWCFLLLTAGTALVMLQADLTDPVFGLIFLKGTFYKAYSLTLDLAGLVVMAALAVFFGRRFFFKPRGLETSREDCRRPNARTGPTDWPQSSRWPRTLPSRLCISPAATPPTTSATGPWPPSSWRSARTPG